MTSRHVQHRCLENLILANIHYLGIDVLKKISC